MKLKKYVEGIYSIIPANLKWQNVSLNNEQFKIQAILFQLTKKYQLVPYKNKFELTYYFTFHCFC